MAANPRPHVRGFFGSVVAFRDKVLLSWDFVIAVVAAAVAWWAVPDTDLAEVARSFGPAALGLAAALVGVVVASLAVVVAFLDDDMLALVSRATRHRGDIDGQLFPYWFVTGTGTGAILAATFLLLLVEVADALVLRILLALTVGLLTWTAVGIFNIVAYLHHLGVSRALLVLARDGESDGDSASRPAAGGVDDE